MSLLLRERVDVGLHAGRVTVARSRRLFGGSGAGEVTVAYVPGHRGDWKSGIDALARALGPEPRPADVRVTLAGEFVRFQVAPWSGAIQNRSEERAYMAHLFGTVYGSVADDWAFAWSMPAYGAARIACAVDRALLAALDETSRSRGARLRSVQPSLAAAFNQYRGLIALESFWFVLVEEGRLTFCLVEDGDWKAVLGERIERAPSTEVLLQLLERMRIAQPARDGLEALVCAPGDSELESALAGLDASFKVRVLKRAAGVRARDTAATSLAVAGKG